jgi:hypothetical protein
VSLNFEVDDGWKLVMTLIGTLKEKGSPDSKIPKHPETCLCLLERMGFHI